MEKKIFSIKISKLNLDTKRIKQFKELKKYKADPYKILYHCMNGINHKIYKVNDNFVITNEILFTLLWKK